MASIIVGSYQVLLLKSNLLLYSTVQRTRTQAGTHILHIANNIIFAIDSSANCCWRYCKVYSTVLYSYEQEYWYEYCTATHISRARLQQVGRYLALRVLSIYIANIGIYLYL